MSDLTLWMERRVFKTYFVKLFILLYYFSDVTMLMDKHFPDISQLDDTDPWIQNFKRTFHLKVGLYPAVLICIYKLLGGGIISEKTHQMCNIFLGSIRVKHDLKYEILHFKNIFQNGPAYWLDLFLDLKPIYSFSFCNKKIFLPQVNQ